MKAGVLMADVLDTRAKRQEAWTLVGAFALEDGQLEWAKQAFEYSGMDNPPREWPADHPASFKNRTPRPKPKWYERLIGKAILKYAEFPRPWRRAAR